MTRKSLQIDIETEPMGERTPLPSVLGSTFVVGLIEGPDERKSMAIEPTEPRIFVGQSKVCALCLRDPHVSRRHISLEAMGNKIKVVDLGSTNGTFIDGVRVEQAYAFEGSIIRLGASALRVDIQNKPASSALSVDTRFGRLIGSSQKMRKLYPLCSRLAKSDISVLIEGETGTGKELLAESIHEASSRKDRPFLVLDCTAVSPTLIEAELFGHERGAFTGALSARKGIFEEADGGTLLIDEIGELPLVLQAKLLRAIDRSQVRRIGSNRSIKFDVRILAATRRNLDLEVQEERFRDDLFHRLAVARIELPPLRERTGDIPLLARHLCSTLTKTPQELPRALVRRWETEPWPGNVRQLKNAVSRFLAFGEESDDGAGMSSPDAAEVARNTQQDAAETHSPDVIEEVLAQNLKLPVAREHVIRSFERRYVARALAQQGGNVVRAARASGVARRYFQILKAKVSK